MSETGRWQGHLIEAKEAIALFGVLLAMLLTGTFFDYQLSCAVFDETNQPALALAAFGEYPFSIGLVCAGSLLLFGDQRRSPGSWAKRFGGVVVIAFGAVTAMVTPRLYLTWPVWTTCGIALACIIFAMLACRALARTAPAGEATRVAAVILLALFAELAIINIIKVPWGRPRMRFIADGTGGVFVPWWLPGAGNRDAFVAAGIAAEEFKSFPSGHSGNAVMLVLLGLLPRLRPVWESRRRGLVIIGFAWGLVVAGTRIVVGAHSLSDVSMGLAIGLACAMLADRIIFRRQPATNRSRS